MEYINIFPYDIRSRLRFNGKSTIKTCFGAACTGLYIVIMLGFTIYYTIPVINLENINITRNRFVSDPTKELFYEDTGPLFFTIQYGHFTNMYPLDRTILDIFVDHYAASRDWEVREYERSVNDWQLKRYFEII